tara:strand:- start:966 stop:1277 length:312 start_codon:yes stop_codon:yes gene_type:complete
MKRYQIEASTFELDGTESHKVLHTSNSISTARAYLAGFTDANDWKQYDLVNLLDTAHPSDSPLFLIDSRMHPSIDNGSTSQSLSDFTEVWQDVGQHGFFRCKL